MCPRTFTMLSPQAMRRATLLCRLSLPVVGHASSAVTVPVKVFTPLEVKSAVSAFSGCPSACVVPVQWPVTSNGGAAAGPGPGRTASPRRAAGMAARTARGIPPPINPSSPSPRPRSVGHANRGVWTSQAGAAPEVCYPGSAGGSPPRDVILKLLDDELLLREDVLDHVPDGDHTDDPLLLLQHG